MTTLDAFMTRLLTKVPGCPDPLAKQALIDSAIEFCEETSITQWTSEPQPVTAGTAVYDLDLPSQTTVATVLRVWYGTTELTPATPADIASILAYVPAAGADVQDTGTPNTYYEFGPGQIAIYPIPTAATALALGLSARVATKPKRNATTVDDLLFEDWVEAIVGGAVYRICSVPGQMFTNPTTAAAGMAKFWTSTGKATTISARGRIRASVTVQARAFA